MVSSISQQRLDSLNCVLGLDCSRYQKDITWSLAKAAGIQFAFVKITEGTTGHEDNVYNLKARILDAQKNKIKVGYYHFARPGNIAEPEDDADEEVQNVISHLGLLPVENLPLALDIEAYSDNDIWDDKIDHMNRFIKTFIQGMQSEGINVILYSYKSFLNENESPIFGDYPLWLAAYLDDPEKYLPSLPNGWNDWNIWQFTEQGQINEYTGNIDLSIMRKEYFNLF
jgi:GH25 family lysozyme M1 (1,4-beta-N-acetylmuramidase)